MDFLQTPRLTLRQMTEQDAPALLHFMGNLRVMYAWEYAFTEEEVLAWIARNRERYARDGAGYFLALRREDGVCVGQAGLMRGDMAGRSVWELGWIFDEAFWGNGYATEAAAGLARYAFANCGVSELWADIRPENTSSIAVARRLGMRPTGERFVKVVKGKEMPHDVYRLDQKDFSAADSAEGDIEQHHQEKTGHNA